MVDGENDASADETQASEGGSGTPSPVAGPASGLTPAGEAPGRPAAAGPKPRVRVVVYAQEPDIRKREEARLRSLPGVSIVDPATGEPQVALYAVRSLREFVALLGPGFQPRLPSILLDLDGTAGPENAALLGALGYVPPKAEPGWLRHCLEQVARGFPCPPQPFDGRFNHARERGPLTARQKQILDLEARGSTREEIEQALQIPAGTLRRRITELRQKLGLRARDLLPLAASRLGFGPEEAAGEADR